MLPPVTSWPLYSTCPETLAGAWGFFEEHPAGTARDTATQSPTRNLIMVNPCAEGKKKSRIAAAPGGPRRGARSPRRRERRAWPDDRPGGGGPDRPRPAESLIPVIAEHEAVVGDEGLGEGVVADGRGHGPDTAVHHHHHHAAGAHGLQPGRVALPDRRHDLHGGNVLRRAGPRVDRVVRSEERRVGKQ